ncbi:MAG: HAD-IIIA family hydrolase [Planctomycetales bacterium]|nr:HAD-IIIA family hydrolase [Planctomycetales bacterium]
MEDSSTSPRENSPSPAVSPGAMYGRGRPVGELGHLSVPLGLGLLRLSTEGRPDACSAERLIHFALLCGIRLLDTADVYGLDERDLHYGERLARRVLEQWSADGAERVRVITKVGLTRRGTRWMPNGRPEHLRASVQRSLEALGQSQLELLLLHARDPQVPYEETLQALAELQHEGLVRHLGLCNTSVLAIEQAQRHFPVSCVQNELSVLQRRSGADGLLRWTGDAGIPFLAHRPLGGHKNVHRIPKSKVLQPLAERHGATPHQVALAALLEAADHVLPIVGATRGESVMSSIGALGLKLDVSDRTALAVSYSFAPASDSLSDSISALQEANLGSSGRVMVGAQAVQRLAPNCGPSQSPEVVLLMGIQGAGKSEQVAAYLEAGYARLNRDELGGTLDGLVPRLVSLLAGGANRVVLDNTYPTRISRAPVIAAARGFGVPVRCRLMDTSLPDAQWNIAQRMTQRYGVPLGPEELKRFGKQDPNLPPPQALLRWLGSYEPPQWDEGFAAIDVVSFVRRRDPEHRHKGLLLDVDGTLRATLSGAFYPRHPDDQRLLPGRRETLRRWVDDGYRLFFVSNQSGVASGQLSLPVMQACFLRTAQLLDLPVQEISYCPHPARPVGCFCRKPAPGLGAYLIQRHQLDIDQLVMVGDMESDAEFANNIGADFHYADDFFAG